MAERVNHPSYYSHPSGAECIDLIRHYVCDIANVFKYIWRAGLKEEEGLTSKEKEAEDIRKAIFYLSDYGKQVSTLDYYHSKPFGVFVHPSGLDVHKIAGAYTDSVGQVFILLWKVGLVIDGHVLHTKDDERMISQAVQRLRLRLLEIQNKNK